MTLRSSVLLVCCVCAPAGKPARKTPDQKVQAYFRTRDSLRKVLVPANGGGIDTALLARARAQLDTRLRAIIGLDSLGGRPLVTNAQPYDDFGGLGLDGLAGHVGSAGVVITTPGLLAGWLGDSLNSSIRPLTALATEDNLTLAFGGDAHVYSMANLLPVAGLPPEVFFAEIVAFTNGEQYHAGDVIVGIDHGKRIYLIEAPVAVLIDETATCGPIWFEAYRACFARQAPLTPDFAKIVEQVKAMAKIPTPPS
jgi:hypothetical protein